MEYRDAERLINEFAAKVLAEPSNGLIGLAIGRKDQGPIVGDGAFCITAFVVQKLLHRTLEDANIRPAWDVISGAARGSMFIQRDDVDVVAIGDEFRAQPYTGSGHANPAAVNTQKWFERLRPGTSAVNPVATYPSSLDAGTISFFVQDRDGDIHLVSCNHVIAGTRTTDGSPPAEVVVQPATLDMTGRDLSKLTALSQIAANFGIADLSACVPLKMHVGTATPYVNKVDAAMARLRQSDRDHCQLGRLPYGGQLLGIAQPYDWDTDAERVVGSANVFKVGRTTGYTEGQVTNTKAVTIVNYKGLKATFDDQLAVDATPDNTGDFSEAGDSGSPLVTVEHNIAGIVFAGGPTRSLANPIATVISELEAAFGKWPITLVC